MTLTSELPTGVLLHVRAIGNYRFESARFPLTNNKIPENFRLGKRILFVRQTLNYYQLLYVK